MALDAHNFATIVAIIVPRPITNGFPFASQLSLEITAVSQDPTLGKLAFPPKVINYLDEFAIEEGLRHMIQAMAPIPMRTWIPWVPVITK